MRKIKSNLPNNLHDPAERSRRKREGIIIVCIIFTVILLTIAEIRTIRFGVDFPISNTILMFILININMLLLVLLIFLVFRNLVKLFYDRRRNVMGAKLRTRLVVAFVTLTLLPMTVLFFFSIHFITTSIEFWFNVPIEQALKNSLTVGQQLYSHIEENNQFFLERIAYQIKSRELLKPEKKTALSRYIQITQREFNLHAVEIYDSSYSRITYSNDTPFFIDYIPILSAEYFQRKFSQKTVFSISEPYGNFELRRTVSTVPFDSYQTEAKAFAVVTIVIPKTLAKNLSSISRGMGEYQQTKLLKKPIQTTYYITLSIVALLVVFCAIWFGFYLAKTITIPIMELAEGTRRVAEGDLSFNIGELGDDEIGSLVNAFNKMTRDLRFSREQLELSAKTLKDKNEEIESRRQYMEIVLKNVSAGVISLDARGFITTINTSAEKMLNLNTKRIINKNYQLLLKGHHMFLANDVMDQITTQKTTMEMPLKLTISGKPKSFMVQATALKDESGRHLGVVLVFDDLTELEKAQRMVAWREVARRIAHEVKNPLTPISLSAQRLKRKYSQVINEPVFDECTATIIDHVELIRNLVNEFSAFAKFPTAKPQPCELPPIINETVALYREAHPNIDFIIQVPDKIPIMNLDRQQIKQAMINLVDNAIPMIQRETGRIEITLTHDPILKSIRIEVTDNGVGIPDEDKIRLFEPYFSTKKTGMGLGLTIVSTIISDHNGMINVQDNIPQGAKFVIELPTLSDLVQTG